MRYVTLIMCSSVLRTCMKKIKKIMQPVVFSGNRVCFQNYLITYNLDFSVSDHFESFMIALYAIYLNDLNNSLATLFIVSKIQQNVEVVFVSFG